MSVQISEIENVAFLAAEAAGKVTLKYFRNLDKIDNKDQKSFDPVTIADQEAEQAIRAVIEAHFPDHAIIGEEFGTKETKSPYRWIIDPIDGTRAFISGLPMWGTLIGVSYRNQPIFGLMSQPFTGDLFYGDCKTAFLKTPTNTSQLRVKQTSDLSQARVFCTTPDMFVTSQAQKQFEKIHAACQTTRFGTDCYGFAALAAGWGDIVFESEVQSYDILPMIPIIQGAGGCVTAFDGSEFTQGGVIASCNPVLHEKIIQEIA